jgi:hypothetical protein
LRCSLPATTLLRALAVLLDALPAIERFDKEQVVA